MTSTSHFVPLQDSASTKLDFDVFENDRERILHEFNFDVQVMEDYHTKLGYRVACLLGPVTYCVAPLCILPCLRINARDQANAQHVAVTKHEILYVQTKYAACFRYSCCDRGTMRKTIPIDRIQDCVLVEPAGGCLPKQTLYRVKIETAGAQSFNPKTGQTQAELELVGLNKEEAVRFTQCVKTLKRQMTDSKLHSAPPAAVLGTPTTLNFTQQNETETLQLLRGIKEGIDRINLGAPLAAEQPLTVGASVNKQVV